MKKTISLLFFSLCIAFFATGQIEEYEVKQIIAPTTYIIDVENMLSRMLGGDDISKRRLGIQIDIPAGTKEWYYIISTSEDKNKAQQKKNGMKLLATVTSVLVTKGTIPSEDVTDVLNFITAPAGELRCNVYHLPNRLEYLNFEKGKGFKSYEHGTKKNIKQGKCKVKNTDHKAHTEYLGVHNNTNMDCSLTIEVVALVSKRGWTPQLKKIISDGFKTEMLKTEMSKILTNKEIGLLSDCATSKITSSLTLDEAAELNSYDYMSRYRNVFLDCADELDYTERLNTSTPEEIVKEEEVEKLNNFIIKDKSYFEGVWNDENSKIIINSGRYAIIWDNGNEISGFWEFENDIISFEMNGKYIAHKITYASNNKFQYHAVSGDKKTYTAIRRR